MILCQNDLSPEEVEFFSHYWENNSHRARVNWEVDGQVLDQRIYLGKESYEFSIVKRIVYKYFDVAEVIWSGYQRQNFAHNIHIDDYGKEGDMHRYTFVFSMVTEPRFRTIVWKEQLHDSAALHTYMDEWGRNKAYLAKKTNISETEDLEHTYDTNQEAYMADYLELDGIYSYQAGQGVLFRATQLHCTSNWIKYPDIPYRELLQIHVVSSQNLDI